MNPQQNQAPMPNGGINLPPPVANIEQPATSLPAPEQVLPSPESAASIAPPAVAPPAQIPMPQQQSVQQNPPANVPNDVTTTSRGVVPSVLEDKDLIEKEWVNRAKKIVEQNRDDPHKQSDELTVVRAEYMQQNYNKTIKLGS